MSQLVSLGLDPRSALELIVVQELVAENVLSPCVGHNKLSSGLASISKWMWTWSEPVSVKQLEDNLLALTVGAWSGLLTDENRLVIVENVDKGLRWLVPEEQAVLSSFVPLDPEPARLELKLRILVEHSCVTKI